MRTLIVYYSRTKTTKAVALKLAEKLQADTEELIDTKKREGALGYISAGRDAMKGAKTKLEELKKSPADYDLVIIATPIWAWKPSVPVTTFIDEQKDNLGEVALVITQGAQPPKQVEIFATMEEQLGKKSMANLHLSTMQVKQDKYSEELRAFVTALHS